MTGSEEKRPFLDDGDDDNSPDHRLDDESLSAYPRSKESPNWWFTSQWISLLFLIANIGFFMLNVGAIASPRSSNTTASSLLLSKDDVPKPFSPADEAITYELRTPETHNMQSPFVGKPRPEFDDAWYKLLYFTNVGVTAAELQKSNQTSLKLKGSDNYLVYLEVFHQLHCLKRMIQIRYPESYPELVASGKLSEAHFNHCVEVLRQSIMCQADTSIIPVKWDANKPDSFKIEVRGYGPRKCVNWTGLLDWSRERFPGEDYEIEVDENGDGMEGP